MKMRASWIRIAGYVAVTIIVTMLLVVATRNQRNQINNSRPQSLLAPSAKTAANSANRDSKWNEAYGKLPLSFQENLGQTDPQVRFVSSGSGYKLFLTAQDAVLEMRSPRKGFSSPLDRAARLKAHIRARAAQKTSVVRLHLQRTNPGTEITGLEKLPGRTDYFIGSDPKAWRTGVPSYSRVKYHEIYPGVDLIFYGNQRRLEYDFVVAPGASPKAIAFDVEGARKLHVNAHGDLVVSVPEGEVELQRPLAYQEIAGEHRNVEAAYTLSANHRVAFSFGAYDSSKPLVVDPVLNYSTYLGGSGDDFANAIAVDALGDAFVAGGTISNDFPTTAGGDQQAPQTASPNGAVFVTELNPTGTSELYSSYLIGSDAGGEEAFGIALDATGDIFVTGQTFSTGFPTNGTLTPLNAGPGDGVGMVFVSEINPLLSNSASLVYSTYFGGTGGDFGNGIAVDPTTAGNVYVTGLTFSADLPTKNGLATPADVAEGTAFLARIDTTQGTSGLIYSTYLGGDGANSVALGLQFADQGFGVTADIAHNAYIAGATTSSNFPTAGDAFQTTLKAANAANIGANAFVTQIDTTKSSNTSLIYSTYLGGSTSDFGLAIALGGPTNVVYVTGSSSSVDFPTTDGAFSNIGTTLGLAYASVVNTTATAPTSSLTYSTLISQPGNGTGGDIGLGIKADSLGNAYLTGGAGSTNFPVTQGAFQPQLAPTASGDAFVLKLNPGGNGKADLIYSTYFGGIGSSPPNGGPDVGNAIAIDATSNAYITGQTFSTAASFPFTSGALQTALDGNSDAFVAKLPLVPTVAVVPSVLNFGTIQDGVTSASQTVTLTNNTTATLTLAVAITDITPPAPATDFAISSNTCGANVAAGGSCTVSVTFTPTLNAAESATLVFTDSDPSSPQNVSLTGTGTTVAADFTLTGPASFTVKDGSSGNFNVTLTSVGGFDSAVNLTCTGEPRKSTCTVQSPVTPTAGGTLAAVTVTTDVKKGMGYVAPNSLRTPPLSMRQVVLLLFALGLVFALPFVRRRGTRLGLAGAMLACVLVAGCGSNGTPKGTSTLTITGTSGNLTHSATVTLTVD
jgi:hypothetical protein